MPFPLLTPRLSIRPLTGADGAAVYAVFAAPEVMRYWNSAPPQDLAEAREWAEYLEDMQRRLGYAQWRLAERAGDRLVGIGGLQPLDGGPDVEVTYALAPAAWGRGFATEAAGAALRFAFEEAHLPRVVGIAKPENHASLDVLRKLGMRALGEAEYWGARWEKLELTARQWSAARAAATPPLRTQRLELRPSASGDRTALLDVFGDPEVMRFVGERREPLDAERLAASQLSVRAHWDEHGFGPLAVVERDSGRLAGEAGLQLLGGSEIELTYTFARSAWGRGYATEAAAAVLRWGFDGLLLPRVVAVADPGNHASLRVLEKLGMRPVGTRWCYGAEHRAFALTLGEWRRRGPAAAAAPDRPGV